MSVAVTIPWRPTPDREQAFRYVVDWYTRNLPDVTVVAVDTGHMEFNRAAARNTCVRTAEDLASDIVIVNDADTIPNLDALHEAIAAANDGLLHFGLDRMAYLTEAETEALYRGETVNPFGKPHDSSVIVIRPASWWAAGGQDERFTGYGGEDGAFTSACTAMLGKPRWHSGTALSLYHDGSCRDIGSERWKPNSELSIRYWVARHSRQATEALIAER